MFNCKTLINIAFGMWKGKEANRQIINAWTNLRIWRVYLEIINAD